MRNFAVIPAAGTGMRMNSKVPKQYLTISNKPILAITLDKIAKINNLQEIVVAINPKDNYFFDLPKPKNVKITAVAGGANRADSVENCLNYLKNIAHADDWIIVHDAARPLVKLKCIHNLLNSIKDSETGGILVAKVNDTIKQQTDNATKTIDRSNIFRALTPQIFRFSLLCRALKSAKNHQVTDEAQAIELLNLDYKLLVGDSSNIKITTKEDLKYAQFLLQEDVI